MKVRLWLLLLGALGAFQVHAACTLRPVAGQTVPHVFEVQDMIVNLDADRPADTTNPVTYSDASPQGYVITYDNCVNGEPTGKTPINLAPQSSNYIFPTNIPGIGVKLRWNNGGAFSSGVLPSTTPVNVGTGAALTYASGSFFRVEVYKTAETLNLNPQATNIALTPNNYVYNWVTSESPTNAAQVLHIGNIQIVSTPSCSFDNSEIVDFGTVTGDMLNAGAQVQKALDFSVTCRTDYGSYSTTASLSSETASADNGYINVTDASGAKDSLAIKVEDSTGKWLKLDGSNNQIINNIASNVPTDFHWKATLMAQPGVQKHPAEGNFTAHAEILLQVK